MSVMPQVTLAAAVTNVTVKVSVVAPSCTINDGKPIEVNFGDVVTTRIDGSRYRKPVDYTLSCPGGGSNALKLQVQGAAAAFDNRVLQTTNPGLGIGLQHDSDSIPVNSWVDFTYPDRPKLWAVPVSQPGVTLTPGEFSASALMKVSYQ
ncbi:exotoxin [Pectobacterium zantedeschiae]|nr:exotoxin [Pectobacterium zantedeschiae]